MPLTNPLPTRPYTVIRTDDRTVWVLHPVGIWADARGRRANTAEMQSTHESFAVLAEPIESGAQ